uniref:Uncharacterized protein n=1 Tax=Calcidiscus leptoporus TaxID=127549 RepID=A0A7S0J189_9EUKA
MNLQHATWAAAPPQWTHHGHNLAHICRILPKTSGITVNHYSFSQSELLRKVGQSVSSSSFGAFASGGWREQNATATLWTKRAADCKRSVVSTSACGNLTQHWYFKRWASARGARDQRAATWGGAVRRLWSRLLKVDRLFVPDVGVVE